MARLVLILGLLAHAAFGIVANFDDLKFSPGFKTQLNASSSSAGSPFTYRSLTYLNWYQGTSSSAGNLKSAGGVIPASQPNVIGSSQYDPIVQDGNIYPAKKISVAAPYRSFDLQGFSYGCTGLSGNRAAGCALAVTGTYANGKGQVAAASFNFFPINQVNSTEMFKVEFPDRFKGLAEIVVGVADGSAGNGPNVLLLDDLSYGLNSY